METALQPANLSGVWFVKTFFVSNGTAMPFKFFKISIYLLLVSFSREAFCDESETAELTVKSGELVFYYEFRDETSRQMKSEFTAVLAAGFAHYTKLFGGLPRDLEGNPYKEVTIRVRHGTLSGEADPRLIILSWNDKTVFGYGTWKAMLLQELLHLWCAESFRYASGSEQWFNEGFTEYFAIRTATQLGYIDNEDALAIAALPVVYYTSAKNLGTLSLREVGENDKLKFQNYFLLYHGGWVVAMLLDENIRTRSNGEKSLEDLMRWMHRNFPRHEQLYQLEDIAAGLKAVSGYDYTEFLRRYVDGKETIPVNKFYNVSDAIWS